MEILLIVGGVVLALIILLLLSAAVIGATRKETEKERDAPAAPRRAKAEVASKEAPTDLQIYESKEDLLSGAEEKLWHALHQIVSDEIAVCPKVRLSDLLNVKAKRETYEWRRAYNHISSKYVDFVLCERATTKVCGLIQIGGEASDRSDQTRDKFMDNAVQAAGLAIVYVEPREEYDLDELARQLESEELTGKG